MTIVKNKEKTKLLSNFSLSTCVRKGLHVLEDGTQVTNTSKSKY